MLFFSEGLLQFHKGFAHIFGLDSEENDEDLQERQEHDGDTDEDQGTVTTADKQFALMSHMKTYSDFCNIKWSEVWDINIIEFFQTLAFIKAYNKKQQERIKEYQRKHKV